MYAPVTFSEGTHQSEQLMRWQGTMRNTTFTEVKLQKRTDTLKRPPLEDSCRHKSCESFRSIGSELEQQESSGQTVDVSVEQHVKYYFSVTFPVELFFSSGQCDVRKTVDRAGNIARV
jgi:hypothetical protein